MAENRRAFNVVMEESAHKRLKDHAARFRVSQSEYVRRVLDWAVSLDPVALLDSGVRLPYWPDFDDEE